MSALWSCRFSLALFELWDVHRLPERSIWVLVRSCSEHLLALLLTGFIMVFHFGFAVDALFDWLGKVLCLRVTRHRVPVTNRWTCWSVSACPEETEIVLRCIQTVTAWWVWSRLAMRGPAATTTLRVAIHFGHFLYCLSLLCMSQWHLRDYFCLLCHRLFFLMKTVLKCSKLLVFACKFCLHLFQFKQYVFILFLSLFIDDVILHIHYVELPVRLVA